MSAEFVHLHLHTDYSLLDGACPVKPLARRLSELGMTAAAISDHGNMCGAVEFYMAMMDRGIKPIIGCETYIAPGSRFERDPRHPHHKGYHQLLLASDLTGYQNLCRLSTSAYLEGHYFKPRIDREILSEHSAGLIATSGCLGAEIPSAILENNDTRAREALGDYLDIFGPGRFFLELQDHGLREQQVVNRELIKYSKEFEIPLVATNDVHYIGKECAHAHELLLCIGTQSTIDDPNRMRFHSNEFYVKSAEEMAELFKDLPDALRQTIAIAEQCSLDLALHGTGRFPAFDTPDGSDHVDYLHSRCLDGLRDRYGIDIGSNGSAAALTGETKDIVDRMTYELGVIKEMKYTSYFLVVWDFLAFAREQRIPIGPGRGSGAGSIVAYLLHITDIDPLRYNLLFERFLNTVRVTPPDFDIDLCERRRSEVIDYVRNKYGEQCVAQIATFGTLKAKAVIKDVSRVMGRTFSEGNMLTQLIPSEIGITLDRAVEESRELSELMKKEEWVNEVITHSKVLEGMVRNMSIHAAGVIIGDRPISDTVPLARGQGDEIITQYPAGPCEALGLLKMDFLGLRTLTIIQDCCDMIQKNHGCTIDPRSLPMEDTKTFDLLNKGSTIAVFQLESSGMRDLCRRFGVSRIEDVIALIALYRPGPMQFLDEFITRKMGQTKVDYELPILREILQETYGIMLYQEQVMQVVQTVAGFSLGEADVFRYAMGKKKPEEMREQHQKYLTGCREKGVPEGKALSLWEKILKFGGYGFNKSHSAAYAVVAYQTAYLKANWPVEFMTSNLSNEMGSSDRISVLITECREMGIEVLPPEVNRSELSFTVDGGHIRFGLAAIKGVGSAAASAMLEARKDGDFTNLVDLCERTGTAVNRRILECLCQCGALDALGHKRSQIFQVIDHVMQRAQDAIRDRESGQSNFFELLGNDESTEVATGDEIIVPDIPEWEQRMMLKHEKELLGFYVTGHPLGEYADLIRTYELGSIAALPSLPDDRGVRIGGVITDLDVKVAKKTGAQWAIVTLEDIDASINCLVFPDVYEACRDMLVVNEPVFLEGVLSRRDGDDALKVISTQIVPINDVRAKYTREIHIRLYETSTTEAVLDHLIVLLQRHPGDVNVILCLTCANGDVAFVEAGKPFRVNFNDELEQAIHDVIGEDGLHVKPDRTAPEPRRRRAPPSRAPAPF